MSKNHYLLCSVVPGLFKDLKHIQEVLNTQKIEFVRSIGRRYESQDLNARTIFGALGFNALSYSYATTNSKSDAQVQKELYNILKRERQRIRGVLNERGAQRYLEIGRRFDRAIDQAINNSRLENPPYLMALLYQLISQEGIGNKMSFQYFGRILNTVSDLERTTIPTIKTLDEQQHALEELVEQRIRS